MLPQKYCVYLLYVGMFFCFFLNHTLLVLQYAESKPSSWSDHMWLMGLYKPKSKI